jgi:hypothetical protein
MLSVFQEKQSNKQLRSLREKSNDYGENNGRSLSVNERAESWYATCPVIRLTRSCVVFDVRIGVGMPDRTE